MKKNSLFLLFLLLISNQMFAQEYVTTAFLEKWQNSKNYLLEIAESMPAENYNYKPTEREMSFQEQLMHIYSNMIWIGETYFTDSTYVKSEKITPKTKAETIAALNNSFDTVSEIIQQINPDDLTTEVEFFAGPKNKIQLLNLLQDHVTHHRGQLIVYLNLNEIEPPKYSGW